ncbi:MAG: LCP family protein [Parasporobacterium sp.]|nr:LCP family protein [Parasporobacterium sp.]
MSSRQPKRITNESPHQKLDPREVKNKATARRNEQYSDHEIYHDDFEIEEFVTYTDIYDDVRNYRRRPSGPSKGRRVIGKILLYLQLAVSILVYVLLFRFKILNTRTLVIIGSVLLVLWLIVFISQRKWFKKIQAAGMILSIVLSIILAMTSLYLARTNSMLKTVTSGKQYDINLYDVVVRAQDGAQTVQDTKGYRFAVQPTFRQEELASVISQLEEELGGEVETVALDSALGQAQALLEGEVDALVYNDVFNSSIAEQLEGYEEQVRILDTYTVKIEAETVQAVDVDIKDAAFLVYISGTDSEGTISMTGRSDVNIVAGINTASKQIILISIPRDYYVEFPGITAAGSRDKLTHAGIYGMDELIATVRELLGHEINYYVRVNFSSMMDIVDAIGGVTVYNEEAFISHGGYYFPAGMVDMNGEYALHYVRERFAFEDGDFARGRNQIKVIQAMMDKLISVNTLANYNSLMTAITNSVATNIPEEDLKAVINIQLNQNPQWHVVSYQMLGNVMFQPCQSTGGSFLSVDMPYLESVENAQILLEQLFAGEPLSEDLQLADNGQLTFITNPAG